MQTMNPSTIFWIVLALIVFPGGVKTALGVSFSRALQVSLIAYGSVYLGWIIVLGIHALILVK